MIGLLNKHKTVITPLYGTTAQGRFQINEIFMEIISRRKVPEIGENENNTGRFY